jgi:hypothetical protein
VLSGAETGKSKSFNRDETRPANLSTREEGLKTELDQEKCPDLGIATKKTEDEISGDGIGQTTKPGRTLENEADAAAASPTTAKRNHGQEKHGRK